MSEKMCVPRNFEGNSSQPHLKGRGMLMFHWLWGLWETLFFLYKWISLQGNPIPPVRPIKLSTSIPQVPGKQSVLHPRRADKKMAKVFGGEVLLVFQVLERWNYIRDVTIQLIKNRVKIPICWWIKNQEFFFLGESIHPYKFWLQEKWLILHLYAFSLVHKIHITFSHALSMLMSWWYN